MHDLLNVVLSLSEKLKYQLGELKLETLGYLNDSRPPDRMKTWIIDSIVSSELFKAEELAQIPALSKAIAHRETSYRFIKINLEAALQVTKKLKKPQQSKEIYELLGDNEYEQIKPYDGRPESLIVPHQNNSIYIHIIQYYKMAGNPSKLVAATLAYNDIKKHIQFLNFQATISQETMANLKKLMEMEVSLSQSNASDILHGLIFGDILPLATNELLDQCVEQEQDRFLFRYLTPVIHDLNNNSRTVPVPDHIRFEAYSYKIEPTVRFVIR